MMLDQILVICGPPMLLLSGSTEGILEIFEIMWKINLV